VILHARTAADVTLREDHHPDGGREVRTAAPPIMSCHLIAPRVALAVGDTAGHAYPALAIAEAFLRRDPGAQVAFFGTPDSIAAGILAREGQTVVPVPGAALRRSGRRAQAHAVLVTLGAIRVARSALVARRARIVIGFGGFASGGVLLAARTLKLFTAIHESNVEPGLANRWLQHVVHRVYVAHAQSTLTGFHVGMPVRSAIARLATEARRPPAGTLRVLILTGSRGAGFLGTVMPDVLRPVVASGIAVEVLQQIHDDEALTLAARYASLDIAARLVPFLEDMQTAYGWADVAIARGGASTLAELAVAGVPAAIVPLADAAADHQTSNTQPWVAAGAGPAVPESAASAAALTAWLAQMASQPSAWRAASEGARTLASPGAANRLVEDCMRFQS